MASGVSTNRLFAVLGAVLIVILVVTWIAVVLQHSSTTIIQHQSDSDSDSTWRPARPRHVGPRVHLANWPYKCWTPVNNPKPELTIVTICGGMPKSYLEVLRSNRLQYVQQHGYRYCEVQTIDQHQIPAFSKLPIMLALLPCTDFLLHLDADAMIYNMSLPVKPWMDFMKVQDLQQLLSGDIIPQSPINFGVFMIRRAPWLWRFYQKLYNFCACDWGRSHDWPAEQGTLYDLLAMSDTNSPERRHTRIIPNKGWNHIPPFDDKPQPDDVVYHITWPSVFAPNSSCLSKLENMPKECKMEGLEYFMRTVIMAGKDVGKDMSQYFVQEDNICQQVRTGKFFSGSETYANQPDAAYSSSVMDFDIDVHTNGSITGVHLGEVGCMGRRDKRCSVKAQWDAKTESGPFKLSCGPVGGAIAGSNC